MTKNEQQSTMSVQKKDCSVLTNVTQMTLIDITHSCRHKKGAQ
jgi:hypothetical protein